MKLTISMLSMIMLIPLFLDRAAFAAKESFGQIQISIDGKSEGTFEIEPALLYNRVKIEYDTTVILQGKHSREILYYPQLEQGDQNVLRFILTGPGDSNTEKYELFVDLGDSIPPVLEWKNESGKIFFAKSGEMRDSPAESRNIDGVFHLNKEGEKTSISGDMDIQFDIAYGNEGNENHHIGLTGNFEVPSGRYRQAAIASASDIEQKKNKYRNNMYLAMAASILIAAFLIFR